METKKKLQKNYKIEKDFKHLDYRCVVLFTNMGHRCGYVGIPKSHPLYGKSYNQDLPSLSEAKKKRLQMPLGENPSFSTMLGMLSGDIGQSVGSLLIVHGGVTYSRTKGDYPVKSNLHWFGYDCAHCNDLPDCESYKENFGEEYNGYKSDWRQGEIRSLSYCIEQCMLLASQLKELETLC